MGEPFPYAGAQPRVLKEPLGHRRPAVNFPQATEALLDFDRALVAVS
jgi:hypothetical protein